MSAFANRVQLEIKNRALGEVNELVLDNAETKEIEGLSADLTSLQTLSLANVGLESLKGLPSLPSLKSLVLSSNSISGDISILVENCPNLEKLNLSNNPITSIDTLKPLTKISSLTHLNIEGCDIKTDDVKSLLGDKIDIASGETKPMNGAGDAAEKNGDSAEADTHDDEDDEDDEPGLEELEKEDLEDDNEDYNPDAEEEEDDEEDDDEEDVDEDDEGDEDEDVESPVRGVKRKADNGDSAEAEAKKVHTENGAGAGAQ